MKNMKISKDENVKMEEQCCIAEQDYPYGLSVSLEEDSIQKLGIDKLPEIGQKFALNAIVEVTSISDYQSQENRNRCIRLQITDMELAGPPKEEKSAESVMYGA